MRYTRAHIVNSINISIKWLAWPVFFLSLYFLFISFSNFIRQYPSVQLLNFDFNFSAVASIILVLLLCLFNWWLESTKWKILVNQLVPCTFNRAVKSVLMGCSFGFITPNRIGDYAGRTIPFEKDVKPKIVVLNLISGFSQFVTVSFIGVICMYFLPVTLSIFTTPVIIVSSILVFLVSGLFFVLAKYPFQLKKLVFYFGIKSSLIQNALNSSAISNRILFYVFGISFIRAMVFIFQLVAVIYILDNSISISSAVIASGVYFFVLTISPSLVFNKLGIREAISILILTPFTVSPVVAALSVFILWFVNQVIPVLAGSILLIKRSVQ